MLPVEPAALQSLVQTAGSPAQTVPAALVTYNFFDVLGLPPSQGRNFTTEEGSDKAANVAIISDDFWRNTLNSRRDVLGSTIVIDGTPRTIIGVMPKAFRHPYRASLWLPLALEPDNPATINNHYLYGVARLRPGVTPVKAEEAVKRMCARINRDDPNPANVRAAYIPPLRESFVMDLRPKILVIVGAAVCALLIAAANFAGLLLARVIEREGEFALRAALGASRRRLVRQQLIQALLLALVGTALGLLIAFWITPMLFALSPEGADATGSAMREFDYAARLDLPVFAFAAGVMTLVGLGFGLLPAVRAARTDLRGAMSVTSRGATLDRSARRLLGSFVVIELAIAAALLTASVTATQYFRKLIEEPWGFETKDRLAFNVTVPDRFFPTAAAKQSALEASLAQLQASARSQIRHRRVAVANGRAVDIDAIQRRRRARTGAARGLYRVLARARARVFPEHRASRSCRAAISMRATLPTRRSSALSAKASRNVFGLTIRRLVNASVGGDSMELALGSRLSASSAT